MTKPKPSADDHFAGWHFTATDTRPAIYIEAGTLQEATAIYNGTVTPPEQSTPREEIINEREVE